MGSSSLFQTSTLYRRRSNGDLQYDGIRPGPQWHSHGYFPRRLWVLNHGRLVRKRLWKRRWLLFGTTTTCHSRPPDDLPFVAFCSLVVLLKLWAWLDSPRGVRTYDDVFPDLGQRGSRRTVQRWLSHFLEDALYVQQTIRRALIERSEPRPMEHMFPNGLSPPVHLTRRGFRKPTAAAKLWRGLAILLGGSIALNVQASVLLAEAPEGITRQKTSPS